MMNLGWRETRRFKNDRYTGSQLRNKMPRSTTFPIGEPTRVSNYFAIELKRFGNNQKCLENLYTRIVLK